MSRSRIRSGHSQPFWSASGSSKLSCALTNDSCGCSFRVKAGQFIAFAGPSGSGKTTVVSLLERFYDCTRGQILVDGQDVAKINLDQYRQQLALVSQTPALYTGTIRDNIAMGSVKARTQVTQDEIEGAARAANIHDFVMSLPDGYDTLVGNKGVQLSGGQRQSAFCSSSSRPSFSD